LTEGAAAGDRRRRPLSAFTIDVEDWYQSCVDYDAPITTRVVRNVDRVLAVLDEFRVKATFFVQGRVAETFPKLIEDLVRQGHEVQPHGYSHRPLFRMNRKELRTELERARAKRSRTLRAAPSRPFGLRTSPSFDKTFGRSRCLPRWVQGRLVDLSNALQALRDSGLEPGSARARTPERKNHSRSAGRGLVGGPLPHSGRRRRLLPCFPSGAPRARSAARGLQRPAIIYCHPYEFNDYELGDYKESVSRTLRFSQGLGRASFVDRIRRLLETLPFDRSDVVLESWGFA